MLTVLCCRPAPPPAGDVDDVPDQPKVAAVIERMVAACAPDEVHFVGRRPGKSLDPLLSGRLLVIGDDADLAAVVQRLLRRDLLGSVEVAYAAARRSPATELWALPHGERAVGLARCGEVDLVPLVRDDVGGVLIAAGYVGPLNGTVYVDEHRVLRGAAQRLRVEPDREKGIAVIITRRRVMGVGRRPSTTLGRAVQIGTAATTVVRDGIPYPRPMDRWTFYRHTEPLRLIRGMP